MGDNIAVLNPNKLKTRIRMTDSGIFAFVHLNSDSNSQRLSQILSLLMQECSKNFIISDWMPSDSESSLALN